MIATLADIVPNFSFWDFFVSFCFYLPLKNVECKVLYLCWVGRLLSLKIRTDICSHFELGQCLLFSSLLPPASPVPLPSLKRKCSSLLQRDRRCVNLRPFDPVHGSGNARVDMLCKISWAVSFCLSMPPLYSNRGHLAGVWDPLGTGAHSWDLVLLAAVSSIVVLPIVCTSLRNFFLNEKQWALGIFQSHASARVSLICKLCQNPISS